MQLFQNFLNLKMLCLFQEFLSNGLVVQTKWGLPTWNLDTWNLTPWQLKPWHLKPETLTPETLTPETLKPHNFFQKFSSKLLQKTKLNRKFAYADRTFGSPGLGSREEGACKCLRTPRRHITGIRLQPHLRHHTSLTHLWEGDFQPPNADTN